jgi:hypothetical protein
MLEKKVSSDRERRFTERFNLPDGLLFYRIIRKLNWLSNFQGPCELNDIASNSASFECTHELGLKKLVELKISLPSFNKEITVKGHIIRKSITKKSGEYLYVVQFSPFGKGYQYNTHMSREDMREFIKSVK